ncbi:RNA polymerase sigma-70 factor, ECF subfamily [Micromonospora rhizosphaerae]|uniref:RNA polymerase sigma-70 factor, ECF subfamily n=1 Tax=Micromonospora rhizosphaerae TaxID=568872 RepID=A0A1C6R9X2_9ACTN|nr:ECF subfamily RNA polymerase sigma factor, BldN family [Micromonospora rhizosphaerae]SCL13915.1 RNA polymerase sigma-70 factor, ECF subfamily [Micromonospora rhizosphaerae]
MSTFGYAERPAALSGPAPRTPVNDRLESARNSAEGMWSLAVRGDGARRVRNRSHHNEAPPRPALPGGNAKPAGARVGAPARPTMPSQGRRAGEAPAMSDPSNSETAVLPAVSATDTEVLPKVPAADTAVLPKVPAEAAPATGYPSRPDPSDPATEVWALVERAQAGEAEAFGLIYDRYVDTVFRFVYFRVGNRQLAEDLTSDTFLRALKRIGSFTWQGRDLGAWLVTIARNLVADHFKSGRYRLEVTTGDVLDADREDRGPEGSPESAVVEHITNVALLTAVKQLNPEQQECIVLRFLQGFSVAETARAMGKNEGAIKALQYRAVRALARLLPDGFQP